MKTLFLLPLLLVPVYIGAQTITDLEYSIRYDPDFKESGIPIDLTIQTIGDSTELFYDNELWGVDSLFNNLLISKENNYGLQYRTDPEKDLIVVYHKPDQKITFTYRIKQTFEEPLADVLIRPVVNNNFFHVVGSGFFVIPMNLLDFDNPDVNIRLNWNNFPDDYLIRTNLGPFKKTMDLSLKLWNEFFDSVIVGGDYRVYIFEIKGKQVETVIRGEWHSGFTDEFFTEKVKNTVTSQRELWDDHEQDYFSVIITPTISTTDSSVKYTSRTGTALYNGFMVQSTNTVYNDKRGFSYLLHHEMMHHWIGSKIRVRNNELNKWFREGFTHYLAIKNMQRTGELSISGWADEMNEHIIGFHWKNPKRNIPNYVIETDFWKSYEVERVPYNRGAIFAFWLDNQIIIKTDGQQSLDDMMRELFETTKKENEKIGDDFIMDLARKYLKTKIDGFFQKHVIIGEDFNLYDEEWLPGINFVEKEGIPILVTNEQFEGF